MLNVDAKKQYPLCVVLSYFVVLAAHFLITVGWGDDSGYGTVPMSGIFQFLHGHYNGHSSRLIIEFFLVLCTHSFLLWRMFNSFMLVLLAHSLVQLTDMRKNSDGGGV